MTPKSLAFAAALVLALVSAASGQDTPRLGGVLKVASIGEPPTLDIPMSTATLVYEIMWHVNESLFTYDKGFNPVPLLAESHAVTDKGLRHTITLRKGSQVPQRQGDDLGRRRAVPAALGRVASIGRASGSTSRAWTPRTRTPW